MQVLVLGVLGLLVLKNQQNQIIIGCLIIIYQHQGFIVIIIIFVCFLCVTS